MSLGRQYVRLMHLPLPLCVFSFATLGAVIAPVLNIERLLWTYIAVFTSLCLASYSFDELTGRPWHTTIPEKQLKILGWTGLIISVLIGLYLAYIVNPIIAAWIPPSGFIILAYNKEIFHGRFHNAWTFALGWGGIPTLGSYYLQTLTISIAALLLSLAMVVFSVALWTLTHELRPDIDTLKELASTVDSERASLGRRSARLRIWRITKMLCYAITFLAVAVTFYRFFP